MTDAQKHLRVALNEIEEESRSAREESTDTEAGSYEEGKIRGKREGLTLAARIVNRHLSDAIHEREAEAGAGDPIHCAHTDDPALAQAEQQMNQEEPEHHGYFSELRDAFREIALAAGIEKPGSHSLEYEKRRILRELPKPPGMRADVEEELEEPELDYDHIADALARLITAVETIREEISDESQHVADYLKRNDVRKSTRIACRIRRRALEYALTKIDHYICERELTDRGT